LINGEVKMSNEINNNASFVKDNEFKMAFGWLACSYFYSIFSRECTEYCWQLIDSTAQ